jgi:uncharacterized protein (TIGR02679 family)
MSSPPEAGARLQQLLGGPDLAALRGRLRRAYEQAEAGDDPPVLRLSALAPHEAEALQALAGRAPSRSASVQLDVQALALSLQAAGLGSSLRSVLEALDGPIAPRAAERAAAASAWAALAANAPHPALQPLLASAAGLGLLKRLAGSDATRAGALCLQAARVLAALPAHGQPRASLAALCLGDAHALDQGQPVASLLLAAWRLAARDARRLSSQNNQGSADAADSAAEGDEGSRALWAAQGVSVNELARPALAINLPQAGLLPDGQPRYWSLRHLLRDPPAWAVSQRNVHVCENPNLLAMAADALGARCAPLVCTDGMPAAAQRALLAQLAAVGARLHYHGDFDWAGIAIANRVLQDFGAQPWRFGAADYRAAVAGAAAEARAPLRGPAVTALWDATLTAELQAAKCAIAEEALALTLLPDLAHAGSAR